MKKIAIMLVVALWIAACKAGDVVEREFNRLALEIEQAMPASQASNALAFSGKRRRDVLQALIVIDKVAKAFHLVLKDDVCHVKDDAHYATVQKEIARRFPDKDTRFGTDGLDLFRDVRKSTFLCDMALSTLFFDWKAGAGELECMKKIKLAAFRELCKALELAPERLEPRVRYGNTDGGLRKRQHQADRGLCVVQ